MEPERSMLLDAFDSDRLLHASLYSLRNVRALFIIMN